MPQTSEASTKAVYAICTGLWDAVFKYVQDEDLGYTSTETVA